MRLTHWTDYSLRMLMYCAIHQERVRAPTVSEIAEVHGISRSHLTKIAMTLAGEGLLETTRGRSGGLRLLKPAREIVVGDVVRLTETDFNLVECFDAGLNSCRIDGYCRLKTVLAEALAAYLHVLDGVTLADLVVQRSPASESPLTQMLGFVPLPPAKAAPKRKAARQTGTEPA